MSIHKFQIVDKIKEELCLRFINTYYLIFNESGWSKISYKEMMREMHIGRIKFQHILNSISVNRMYIKIELGYIISGSNITSGVDRSKRFLLYGEPVYHFEIKKFKYSGIY